MIPVVEVPLQLDLSEFAACLWRSGVAHRVTESEQCQVIWVENPADASRVQQLFTLWQNGEPLEQVVLEQVNQRRLPAAPPLRRVPLTLALAAASIAISLLIGFGQQRDLMGLFSFSPFSVSGNTLQYAALEQVLLSGQLWRLWTPVFMHFSVIHILFNLLWVWIVGGKMEATQGAWSLLGLVLFSGLMSNLAQFWVSGPMFGGMSGVVFALIAYSWIWDRHVSTPRFGLPPALMGLLLFWLVLGFTGVLEGVGLGAIANTAHLVGLVCGLIWLPVGRWLCRGKGTSV